MSRLRKGKKFKGGSFAETFKKGISTNTPFAVVVPGMDAINKAKEAADGAIDAVKGERQARQQDVIASDTY